MRIYAQQKAERRSRRGLTTRVLPLVLVAAGLTPSLAHSLGLGDISFQTHLGEPLQAKIDLVNIPADLDEQNVRLRQVHPEDASRMGVEIISSWHQLEFSLDTRRPDYQISLRSRRPVKEPFINFLVELSWPKGTLFREYTLFLDPAGMATVAPEKTVEKTAKSATTLPSTAKTALKTGRYTVASGDSLSRIAHQISQQNGLPAEQLVDWIYTNNPQAFADGDINRLLAGATLSIPGARAQTENRGRLVVRNQPTRFQQNANKAENHLQANVSANNQALEQLIKENRDLRERLEFIESSGYINDMQKLLTLQQQELKTLRARLARLENQPQPEQAQNTQPAPSLAMAALESPVAAAVAASAKGTPDYLWGLLIAGATLLMTFTYAMTRLLLRPAASQAPISTTTPQPPAVQAKQQKPSRELSLDEIDNFMEDMHGAKPAPAKARRQHKSVLEANAEEARKVELIQQQIKDKVGDYKGSGNTASNDMHLQEIEIDPDLESYLKI